MVLLHTWNFLPGGGNTACITPLANRCLSRLLPEGGGLDSLVGNSRRNAW